MNQITSLLVAGQLFPAVAAPLVAITILLAERRDVKIVALGFQYVLVAWLVVGSVPIESAIAKLVAGLISVLIYFWGVVRITNSSRRYRATASFPRGRVFRITAVLLVVIGTFGVSLEELMPTDALNQYIEQAALLLAVLGILGIGLYIDPLQVGISLVTLISGFEIIYSAIEPSLAIVALLALVHLGITLTISYFVIIRSEVDEGGIDQ